MNGAERITLERERQIVSEGYDINQDQRYKNGELVDASVSYLIVNSVRIMYNDENAIPHQYPWSEESFKSNPNDRIRDLEKAGALIAAEIDRLLADKFDQELKNK